MIAVVAFAVILVLVAIAFGLVLRRLSPYLRIGAIAPAAVWTTYFIGLRAGWWGDGTGDGWSIALVVGAIVLLLFTGAGAIVAHHFGSRTRSKRAT